MTDGPPPRNEISAEEDNPPNKVKTNGSLGSLALQLAAMVCLLAITLLDAFKPDWEPSVHLVVGFIGVMFGITGKEAVALLKSRFGRDSSTS